MKTFPTALSSLGILEIALFCWSITRSNRPTILPVLSPFQPEENGLKKKGWVDMENDPLVRRHTHTCSHVDTHKRSPLLSQALHLPLMFAVQFEGISVSCSDAMKCNQSLGTGHGGTWWSSGPDPPASVALQMRMALL